MKKIIISLDHVVGAIVAAYAREMEIKCMDCRNENQGRIVVRFSVDLMKRSQLDKLEDTALRSSEGDRLQLNLQGYAVAYNKLTGKFYKHRIYSDKIIPEAFSSRWDWTHEEWGYAVKAEVKRILEVKKVTLDAPRMSKL